jgi:hypothetical protein
MVNDIDASGPRRSSAQDPAPLDLTQQVANGSIPTVVIAQSGVTTGFNITSVQIMDSVGPNFRTRNTVTTDIDMTITEPYGMTLIGRMFLASRQLGIRNWRLAPLLLELSFKILDQNGNPLQGQAEPIRKMYKIILVDTESTLTEVGSTYRIKASAEGTVGFKDFWFIIPQTYKVVAGQTTETSTSIIRASQGTVGAFFETLGRQLTDFYREQRNNTRGTATTPLIFYNFAVAPELAEKEINFSNETNGRRLGFSTPGAVSQEITVGRGISIADVIDDICASLRDVTFFTPPNSETSGQIRVPRIECTVELLGYDVVLNDYIRQFNYVIGVLETLRPTPTVEHGRRFQTSIENQTNRTQSTATSGILRKFYPYYYTGMNTEIIKLDLTFNQLHIISLPLYNGGTLPPAAIGSSIAARLPQLQAQYQQLTRTIADNQAAYAQNQALDRDLARIEENARRGRLQNQNPSALESEIRTEANQPLQRNYASVTNNEQTNIQRIAQQRRQIVRGEQSLLAATIQDNQATLGEVSNEILNLQTGSLVFFNQDDPRRLGQTDPRAEQLFRQAQQAREQSRARQSRTFAEDIPISNYSSPSDFAGLYTYAADPRDIANHLARSATTADNSNEVRGVYTTILAQLYDRQGQHLTEIEMEIRGDPYWLGFSNVERQTELDAYIRQAAAAQGGIPRSFGRLLNNQESARYANYVDRDASFLLLFRPGDQPNEQTGYMDFKDSVFFNGIYHTIEVTHVFNNGQFTQKLRAVRDLININAVRDAPQTAAPNRSSSATVASVPASAPAGQIAPPVQNTVTSTAPIAPRPAPVIGNADPPPNISNPPSNAYQRAADEIQTEQRRAGNLWPRVTEEEVVARMSAADRQQYQNQVQLNTANAERARFGLPPLSRLGG